MLKNLLLLTASIFFIAQLNLLAQDEKDTTLNRWYDDWEDFEWFDWEIRGKPFIEANYGIGKAFHKKMYYDFAKAGLAEIKMGYASREDFFDEKVIEFSEKFFFASKIGSDLQSSTKQWKELRSDMWRFGFSKRNGYGYKTGAFYILPYYSSGFQWTRLDMKDYPPSAFLLTDPPIVVTGARTDTEILNRFNKSFRFGTLSEGGIRFDIASQVSFNAGYETAVVFPRHLFWKHIGSMVIEGAVFGMLDRFIDEIADSSPYASPLVNCLLKNGLSYALYTLKKEKMNWPFNTEAPLTYEMLKFGVTFTF